jgi:His-Xaa-Ser system radical SAM maturase HxsC
MKLAHDIPLRDIKEAVHQSKKYIGLTGGEPTCSKELFTIIRYIRSVKPNLYIFIVSNGRKFADKSYAKKFAKLATPPFRIGIPLFSHVPEIHDHITQAEGSWHETVKGIKNLITEGVRVELRIIVERPNYRLLPDTARFVVENFKGLDRVVFINMKYTGNAFINRKKIFVRYKHLVPYVQQATDVLLEHGFEVKMFHFPLCTIDKKYWKYAQGITKQEVELTFLKRCSECVVREKCPRIWKTYLPLAGDDEFQPITRV